MTSTWSSGPGLFGSSLPLPCEAEARRDSGDILGFWAEPAVAADGAGITAFRGIQSLQPAPLLNFFVRIHMMRMRDWRTFLETYSQELLAANDLWLDVPDEVRRAGWMGFAPAAEAAIVAAEHRLGRALPALLRSFYAVSNGWRQTGYFVFNVLPVEELGWLSQREPYLYELTCGVEQTPGPWQDDPGNVRLQEYREEQGSRVMRSQVISSEGDAATWLLDPGSKPHSGEWPGGCWAGWNPAMEWSAQSFGELMENELKSFLELRDSNSAAQ
jgi:hypothetical protein